MEPDSFPFLEAVPEELQLVHYCPTCFEETMVPAQEKYEAMMALARKINIFFVTEKNLPRLLKKAHRPVQIQNCKDRDETVLRLGFKAAELGFNSLVKVDVSATQIRNLTHQKNSWHGVGIPADIDESRYFR